MKLNYKIAFLAITLVTTGIYAECPNLSMAWKNVAEKKFLQAEDEITQVHKNLPHSRWSQTFTEDTNAEVEEWVHIFLAKFYVAYCENNKQKMEEINEQIQNLIHLEFEGNHGGIK
jgi:hypothetical protein